MLEADDPRTLGGEPQAADGAIHDSEAAYRLALQAELERRVAELAATSDRAFGRMGWGDTVVVTALCVLLPVLVVWLWR